MAKYGRDIVATRNLNKKNKARLKATGDTEKGYINGAWSHINIDEKRQLDNADKKDRLTAADAYDISFRERAEKDIVRKAKGGTINPFDGMPEYHTEQQIMHQHEGGNPSADYTYIGDYMPGDVGGNVNEDRGISGEQTYETLTDPSFDLESYLMSEFGIGDEYSEFIQDFKEKPFELLQTQYNVTTDKALKDKEFTERQLESTYSATMGALGSREETLGLQQEGFVAEQAGLGRSTGRQYGQAVGGAATAASQSGLATSGTITQGMETQRSQLFEDYTAGTESIQRGMEGVQIGLRDVGRERTTALEALTLGQDVARSDYGFARAGATIDLEQGTYNEQQRQVDQLYEQAGDVTAMMDAGGDDGGCCFIVLEVDEENGLNKDVRKYRDEMMNDYNRSGYYKLAQVVVPLMRKSKLVKWFFKYLFVNPAKSWAKWHYHKKGIGWIYEPLRISWLGLFNYLGLDHKLKVDRG